MELRRAEYEKIKKKYGDKVFLASEAPEMKVISTGVPSLDVLLGIGGWPRGSIVEIFGRPSVGKSALSYYTIQEVHRAGGFAAFINLESNMTAQIEWMKKICPDIDMERLVIYNPRPGQDAITQFSEAIASGAFDVVIFDSIGAMSTDKELEIGHLKQAYGQSAMVTQLVKQALFNAQEVQCVPIILNQIRDQSAGTFTLEKAPGGWAKEFLSVIRIQMKPGPPADGIVGPYMDNPKFQKMRRINASLVKNKMDVPGGMTGWDFWQIPSDDGITGIDIPQNIIDTALQTGTIERGGAIYKYASFPDGKIKSRDEVKKWFKENPDMIESIRREMVLNRFNRKVNTIEISEEVSSESSEVTDG